MKTSAEGDDITEAFGRRQIRAACAARHGRFSREFSRFHSRKPMKCACKACPKCWTNCAGLPYVATLKYDGTSSTFALTRAREFHACGRNFSLQDGDNIYWRAARKYDLEAILRRPPHLAIQGELCGPGIQKNRLNLKEVSLFVFNIYDFQNARYLVARRSGQWLPQNGLTPVEVVEEGDSFAHTQESLLALAEGKYPGTHERA